MDSSVKIAAVKIDAPKNVLCTRVTRVSGNDRLGELPGFLHIAGAEASHGGIHGNVRLLP